jgi:VanZ family protein
MNPHSATARWFFTIMVASAWLVCFLGTHTPADRIPSTGLTDKTLHSFGYGILAGLFLLALWSRGVSWARRGAWSLAVLLAYAAIDESTQLLVGRDASIFDWLADALGVALALGTDAVATLLTRIHNTLASTARRRRGS